MATDLRSQRSFVAERNPADGQGASEQDEAPRERLGSYGALTGGYAAAVGAFLAFKRGELPENVAFGDLALLGIATHKTSRALTKDRVTAPLRAPFTEH